MSFQPRRRSVDSGDGSSAPPFPSEHGSPPFPSAPGFPSAHGAPQFPSPAPQFPSEKPQFPSPHDSAQFSPGNVADQKEKGFENKQHGGPSSPPPYTTASPSAPPPSGFRIPLTATGDFPDPQTLGQPPCYDADGSPIYIGSALLGNSVHPCKIGKHLQPYVSVPYGGAEYGHHGRYDLLPYRSDQMEFVPTSYGKIPPGRRPIEGGYEDHGAKLYHAVALINGVRIPGKTAEHLRGCNVSFGGSEHAIQGNYEILCWR